MSKKQLVLALFENEAAADDAVKAIKKWDKDNHDVKLGAIGVLVKNDKGKIKTHKLGSRRTGGGAVLFALAALLTGGMVLGGAVVGGIIGSLFHKGLKMSDEDRERLNKELDNGKAAVGVMTGADAVADVTAKLAELGSEPETFELSDEAVADAEEVAAAAPEEDASEEEEDAEPATDQED
ncbi:MAG: hypothetical protein M9928_06330 [Anaerolineae bacterium]|nr:hypothetical protein [Anaerolineae bacterium]MCO5194922.1 hypothetical protein [Anaerolineae bacterium]MCO5204626.1 hypothetical protein [Anaerolineae bacterium]